MEMQIRRMKVLLEVTRDWGTQRMQSKEGDQLKAIGDNQRKHRVGQKERKCWLESKVKSQRPVVSSCGRGSAKLSGAPPVNPGLRIWVVELAALQFSYSERNITTKVLKPHRE